jgi:Zn-dependent peptidase ImmA (M78 family)
MSGMAMTNDAPKKIKVGPFTFKVKLVTKTKQFKSIPKGLHPNDLMGRFSLQEGTIYLKDKLPNSVKSETLFHELLHAVWETTGGTTTELEEEKIISMISPTLLAALKDNKELRRYLFND